MNLHRSWIKELVEEFDYTGELAQRCASKNPKARKRMYSRLLRKKAAAWREAMRKIELVDE